MEERFLNVCLGILKDDKETNINHMPFQVFISRLEQFVVSVKWSLIFCNVPLIRISVIRIFVSARLALLSNITLFHTTYHLISRFSACENTLFCLTAQLYCIGRSGNGHILSVHCDNDKGFCFVLFHMLLKVPHTRATVWTTPRNSWNY